jgi:predicted ATP-grasp superfamily ATP-dependent carboligase
MAKKDGERRMVFDTGGRRRGVVKVVYAILAVLMGLSLLLVVGPAPLQELFGVKDTVSNAADQFEEQAERSEQKLKRNPEDTALLLALTRARINAANALAESNPETGEVAYSPEGVQQLQGASESWSKYLKATDEPSPAGAQVAAQALFGLAQNARTGPEAELNLRAAAKAQQIVAVARPSIGSLSTLAFYRLYSFDYGGAAKAQKEAKTFANTKFERENLDNEIDQISKRAHEFQKQLTEIEKEAKKSREKGEAPVANPLSENNPLGGP